MSVSQVFEYCSTTPAQFYMDKRYGVFCDLTIMVAYEDIQYDVCNTVRRRAHEVLGTYCSATVIDGAVDDVCAYIRSTKVNTHMFTWQDYINEATVLMRRIPNFVKMVEMSVFHQ